MRETVSQRVEIPSVEEAVQEGKELGFPGPKTDLRMDSLTQRW